MPISTNWNPLYICDRKKCEVCNECMYTTDINHAANFVVEAGDGYCYYCEKTLEVIDKFQELIDKATTPKKPIFQPSDSDYREYKVGRCPICKTIVYDSENRKDLYCHHCGQLLDWRENV